MATMFKKPANSELDPKSAGIPEMVLKFCAVDSKTDLKNKPESESYSHNMVRLKVPDALSCG